MDYNTVKNNLDGLSVEVTSLSNDRDKWKNKYENITKAYNTIMVKYSELDTIVPTLKVGTYDLIVDCNGEERSLQNFHQYLKANNGVYFNLIPINISSNFTNADRMFHDCDSLVSIDTSGFTSVTIADSMFSDCNNLKSIDTKGFTSINSATQMFANCSNLTNIDTGGLTAISNASLMFYSCKKLTSIDTSGFTNVRDAHNMFQFCSSLTSIDSRGFTNVTNANSMFSACSNLTSIDTSGFTNVTNAGLMFERCSNLKSIDTNGFTKVNYAYGIFMDCEKLTSIDTRGFTYYPSIDCGNMFFGCKSLKTVLWGDSFRPNTRDNIFHPNLVIVDGVVLASEASSSWINFHKDDLGLNYYKIITR